MGHNDENEPGGVIQSKLVAAMSIADMMELKKGQSYDLAQGAKIIATSANIANAEKLAKRGGYTLKGKSGGSWKIVKN